MAALLALIKHSSTKSQHHDHDTCTILSVDIEHRIHKAKASLNRQFIDWDVKQCDCVGFEIVVPTLMTMLEDYGMTFKFPGKAYLMKLNDDKLSKFQPETLYKPSQTTPLHSLEAFVGKIDFDRVKHHVTNGSMMASPSSTAAYLINSSTWDHEAENYLRTTIIEGSGKGNGSVPCAFPTTMFELSWVISTLLKAGISAKALGKYNLRILACLLERELQTRNGVIGFAPSLLADADDTAKTILTLCLLGRAVSPDEMIAKFEVDTHFQTYALERNASFSANCNVLNTLLHVPEPRRYVPQILKTAKFLCNAWSGGKAKDKWNLSPLYSMMLLAQTFQKLLRLWDDGLLPDLPKSIPGEELPHVLVQIRERTLQSQNANGSWGANDSCEITSYAILTLVEVDADVETLAAIRKGELFLNRCRSRWEDVRHIWIEKVTYGSIVLSKTYCLTASHAASVLAPASVDPIPWKPLLDADGNSSKDKLGNSLQESSITHVVA